MNSFIGMGGDFGPRSNYDKHKHRDGPPQEMNIPKGYKSPFAEIEQSLTLLWEGNGAFLRKYAPKKIKSVSFYQKQTMKHIRKESSPEDEEELGG